MQKNKEGFGYKYVDEESILLKANEMMLNLGVRLTPSINPDTTEFQIISYKDKKDKDVTEVIVHGEMTFTWEEVETGETETVSWALFGQQSDASQSFGSGLTYSNRYFLLKYFNIATSQDDPDAIRSKQQKEEAEKEKKEKISATQTKIKKLFGECVTKFGGNKETYAKLGTSATEFNKNFNDETKQDTLIEQMEMVLKDA